MTPKITKEPIPDDPWGETEEQERGETEEQETAAAGKPEEKTKRGKSAASESRIHQRDVDDLLEGIEAYIKKGRDKLSQNAHRIEHIRMREEAETEAKLIKYRSLLNMIWPGFERAVKVSRIAEEPGNREFLRSMKLRV